jgi:sulfite reductase (ferredoxin)
MPEAVNELKIKVSGCFNSCGQHHVADIGFFGNSRRRNNQMVPHFQVVLGGRWNENAGSYGQMMGAVPSRAVPDLLKALTTRFAEERNEGEDFQAWIGRLGKRQIKELLAPFTGVPEHSIDPTFYSDWGDPREFTIGDIGVGECAGEVVSLFSIEISRAEGEAFDALVSLEEGDYEQADRRAYRAMLLAARALVRTQFLDVGDDPQRIVEEFRTRFYDTQLFFDRFARGKFAEYLFKRHENPPVPVTDDHAQQIAEEAHLFIEAAHACDARLANSVGSVIQVG